MVPWRSGPLAWPCLRFSPGRWPLALGFSPSLRQASPAGPGLPYGRRRQAFLAGSFFFRSICFKMAYLRCGRPASPLPRRPISLQCGWAPLAVALPPWPAGWRPVADRRLVGCVIWWKFVWVFPGLPGAVRSRDSYATATVPATLLRLARVSRCLPESVKAGPLRLSIFFFFSRGLFFFFF